MRKVLFLLPLFSFPFAAYAADSANCDALLNQNLLFVNITNNTADQLAAIENGRLKLNRDNPRLKSRNEEKAGKKSTFTFDRVVQTATGPLTITETVDYDATGKNSSLKYMTDKKLAKTIQPLNIYGQKITFHDDGNGNCTMVQVSNFVQDNVRSFAELVKTDAAFCDSVKDIVKGMSKETFDQCQSSLKKASALYNKRAKELEKSEQKFISLGDNNLATTIEALRSCSPEEWKAQMTAPLNQTVVASAIFNRPTNNNVKFGPEKEAEKSGQR